MVEDDQRARMTLRWMKLWESVLEMEHVGNTKSMVIVLHSDMKGFYLEFHVQSSNPCRQW